MTDTTERAELLARIECAFQRNVNCVITPVEARGYITALRRLAAQNQKPVAFRYRWKIDGEWVDWRVSDASQKSRHLPSLEEIPLYLSPPPAAGWDEAIEAAKLVVERWSLPTVQTPSMWLIDKAGIVAEIEALRHNAPPDTGAGKSEPRWGDSGPIPGHHFGDEFDARPQPSAPPPHGGADAGVRVKPLEWEQPDGPEGTAWLGHGTDMCQYYIRFDTETASYWMPGERHLSDDDDSAEEFLSLDEAKAAAQADYERRIISALSHQPASVAALDDLVARFSVALLKKLKQAQANGRSGWEKDDWEADCQRGLLRHVEKGDPRDVAAYCAFMWHHGWITSRPAAAEVNASAEAKNALYWVVGRWNAEVLNRPLQNIHRRSLDDTWRQVIRHFGGNDRELCGPTHDELLDGAAHPHASDCDKQGER